MIIKIDSPSLTANTCAKGQGNALKPYLSKRQGTESIRKRIAKIPRRASKLSLREFTKWLVYSSIVYPLRQRKELSFDRKHGTDTSEMVYNVGSDTNSDLREHFVHYQGSPPELVRSELERQELDFTKYTFIDLGCGKGRPLMIASQFPFRQLTGVEVDQDIARKCNDNVDKFLAHDSERRCDVEVRFESVTEFDFPEGNLLIFMFNPFGAPVMKIVMDRLVNAIPKEDRHIRICYFNSFEKDSIMGVKGMKHVSESTRRYPNILNHDGNVTILTTEIYQASMASAQFQPSTESPAFPLEVTSLSNCEAESQQWEHFLSRASDGYHEQGLAFAEERERLGFTHERLVCRENGRIVGGLQIMIRRIPLLGKHGIVQRGPAILNGREDVADLLLGSLNELARRTNLSLITILGFPGQSCLLQKVKDHGFVESSAWSYIEETYRVPLKPSEEDILAGMSSKGRYNIRLAKRRGVIIEQCGVEDLPIFFDLYNQTAKHQDFPTFSSEFFENMFKSMAPSNKAALFIAKKDGKPIAAILNQVSAQRMYYCWGGMSRLNEDRKNMPNYLLHWHAIQWARQRGLSYYELGTPNDFKRRIAECGFEYPQPRRKFFGHLSRLRRFGYELSWDHEKARQLMGKISHRLIPRLAY